MAEDNDARYEVISTISYRYTYYDASHYQNHISQSINPIPFIIIILVPGGKITDEHDNN